MAGIYTYRITLVDVSWTFRSYDPLPLETPLSVVQYFAINGRAQYGVWWIAGERRGVAFDEDHARSAARKWVKLENAPPLVIGRIVHELELELQGGKS
jgi:hypothetical protein